MQHWEDTSFLWCCCDLLWGIRVCMYPASLLKYGIFFRHPDLLVVFPFVGGWSRMLQKFQARCVLLPMHEQILEPQPHSSTSHQVINYKSKVFRPPRPDRILDLWDYFTIHTLWLSSPSLTVGSGCYSSNSRQMYKHDACFYPVHKQILEPHPHSSTSHHVHSILDSPPSGGGGGTLLELVIFITQCHHRLFVSGCFRNLRWVHKVISPIEAVPGHLSSSGRHCCKLVKNLGIFLTEAFELTLTSQSIPPNVGITGLNSR